MVPHISRLRKTFDSICKNVLLSMLIQASIKSKKFRIIENFLKKRLLSIKINEYWSKHFNVSVRLPQGRVVLPLLFIFFI